MKITLRVTLISILAVLAILLTHANAEIKDSNRGKKGEWYLLVNWADSGTIEFHGGSEVSLNADLGRGVGFAYNLNEQVNLAVEFSWNSASYDVSSVDGNGDPVNFSGVLYTDKIFFDVTYNILPKALTPFVTGGFGWTFIDTNIPTGVPICWWDPWWGYVCTQSTYTDTSFSYNIGAGIRWDVTKSFFLKGSVNNTSIDIDRASGTPSFFNSRFDFGFMF